MRLASSVRNADRVRDITEIAVKHGFGYWVERHQLRNLLPKGWRGGPKPVGTRGEHMRKMFEELRLTIECLFLDIDEGNIYVASIGEVHRAVLPNGDQVIVKVQRPEAEARIRSDTDLLFQLAQLLRDHSPKDFFIDPVGLVDQFSRGIRNELDYRVEARNAERFRENFRDDHTVHIPRVYWQYSTSRVLTLEWVDGVQLADIDAAAMDMGERQALATTIAQCWLKQIYIDGFFHGDPHPANIMVLKGGAIGLVDFGIAGRLSDNDRQNIINLFLDIEFARPNTRKFLRRRCSPESIGARGGREI